MEKARDESRSRPPVTQACVLAIALLICGQATRAVGQAGVTAQAPGDPARSAATTTRKVLTIDDYDRWRAIGDVSISDDGVWLAYVLRYPNAVDSRPALHAVELDTGRTYQVAGASQPVFSGDAGWISYTIGEGVGLLDLASGETASWETADRIGFSPTATHFAVRKVAVPTGDSEVPEEVIVKDLRTRTDTVLVGTSELSFNASGDLLAYTVVEESGNGLHALDLDTGADVTLHEGSQAYARPTWDRSGNAIAVLVGSEVEGMVERENFLVAFRDVRAAIAAAILGGAPEMTGQPERVLFTPSADTGAFPPGMVISERGELTWSEDGTKIFFGIKPQEARRQAEADPSIFANVEVWHWSDERIQSVQMAQAQRNRNFTYLSVLDLETGRFIRLANDTLRTVLFGARGSVAIGIDERPYVSDWRRRRADFYRVDTSTGERRRFLEGHEVPANSGGLARAVRLSPDGRSVVYWQEGDFWVYNTGRDTSRNLTAGAPVSFENRSWNLPGNPPPYWAVGWTSDSRSILLHGEYDLWLQPLDGGVATNLTLGAGAEQEIELRLDRVALDWMVVDHDEPLLLTASGRWTKQAGFYRLHRGRLERLVYDDARYGWPLKAKNAERYVFTRETFVDFPDLWVGRSDLSDRRRVTEANPWQSEYSWGRRILFEYRNKDGVRLQGTLAIPDDYEPGERRPLLVHFYEARSQALHEHAPPAHMGGFYGPLMEAVSKGYLVMEPDVHFTVGRPHADMLECVEAATRKVIEMGFADPDRIGVYGHSYGGQGAVYVAARSKMFAAAAAGAAQTDVTGDFNRFWGWTPTNRRGPGRNGQFYDMSAQGRLGTDPFTDPDLYREESPITYADSIETPLLMMHGTVDTTVGVMGALQMYNAMRFNNKNIIVLLYPGERHFLAQRGNRRDLTIRMMQFFDHWLLNRPAPRWMTEGVPFLESRPVRVPR